MSSSLTRSGLGAGSRDLVRTNFPLSLMRIESAMWLPYHSINWVSQNFLLLKIYNYRAVCEELNKRVVVVCFFHVCAALYKLTRSVSCLVFINVSYKLSFFVSSDDGDKQTIREAADVIAKHTCIRFVERQDQEDYIEFYEGSK